MKIQTKSIAIITLICTLAWLVLVPIHALLSQFPKTLITKMTWSPNGQYIAFSGYGFTGVFDVLAHETVFELTHLNSEQEAAHEWDATSTRLAIAADNLVQVWNLSNRSLLFETPPDEHDFTLSGLDWSYDGSLLLISYLAPSVADFNSILYLRDSETYRVVSRLTDVVFGEISLNPNNDYLALSYASSEPIIISLQRPSDLPIRLEGYEGPTIAYAWSHSGLFFAVGYADGKIAIWNSDHFSQPQLLDTGVNEDIRSLAWSPNDDQIVVTGDDAIVRVLEVSTGNLIYESPTRVAVTADFSPYGGRIVFGGHLIEGVNQTPQLSSIPSVLQFIVPEPMIDRLNVIAESCIAPDARVTSVSDEARLAEFVTTIEALSDDQIPAGCKADLLAVAEAIEALR